MRRNTPFAAEIVRRFAGHPDPYRHHAFEQHFGLTDTRGRPKATLTEMKGFGTRFAVITSHADEELTVKPVLAAAAGQTPPAGLTPLGETEIIDRVTLHPFGITVLRIAES